MQEMRIFFTKKDEAVYISHLDLMRCFERSLRRSGVPFWYTEGFNPHPFMTFALPLSLGITGLRESVDIRLTGEMAPDGMAARLNACLPSGVRVTGVAEPVRKPTDIAFSKYLISFYDDTITLQNLLDFCGQDEIRTTKLNKKKQSVEVDIKQMMRDWSAGDEEGPFLCVTLPSGAGLTCNPSLLISALAAWRGVSGLCAKITRTAVLCADGTNFA